MRWRDLMSIGLWFSWTICVVSSHQARAHTNSTAEDRWNDNRAQDDAHGARRADVGRPATVASIDDGLNEAHLHPFRVGVESLPARHPEVRLRRDVDLLTASCPHHSCRLHWHVYDREPGVRPRVDERFPPVRRRPQRQHHCQRDEHAGMMA